MPVHLHAVTDTPTSESGTTYFVIRRQNGHWSVAATIVGVFHGEAAAEGAALHAKEAQPHQHFGVAALRSEARTVPKPIEIVRLTEGGE